MHVIILNMQLLHNNNNRQMLQKSHLKCCKEAPSPHTPNDTSSNSSPLQSHTHNVDSTLSRSLPLLSSLLSPLRTFLLFSSLQLSAVLSLSFSFYFLQFLLILFTLFFLRLFFFSLHSNTYPSTHSPSNTSILHPVMLTSLPLSPSLSLCLFTSSHTHAIYSMSVKWVLNHTHALSSFLLSLSSSSLSTHLHLHPLSLSPSRFPADRQLESRLFIKSASMYLWATSLCPPPPTPFTLAPTPLLPSPASPPLSPDSSHHKTCIIHRPQSVSEPPTESMESAWGFQCSPSPPSAPPHPHRSSSSPSLPSRSSPYYWAGVAWRRLKKQWGWGRAGKGRER